MGIADSALSHLTAAVLNGDKAGKIKDFTFDGHSFVQSHLAHMAVEITHPDGKLTVEYLSSLNGTAEYDHEVNTLFLGFIMPDTLTKGGLIVHEATHALFDFKASNMDIATSESLSYIAQCQFVRANSSDPDPEARLYSEDENKDKVFEVGWRIAGKILGGGSIESSDVTDMKDAVSRHPYYQSKHGNDAGFDGM